MVEKELDFVKVQARQAGNFMVTIPREAVLELKLKGDEKIKVIMDKEKRRVIYQF